VTETEATFAYIKYGHNIDPTFLYAFPCPVCAAGIGEPCVTKGATHIMRFGAAYEAALQGEDEHLKENDP
jgi:hypothetical protein